VAAYEEHTPETGIHILFHVIYLIVSLYNSRFILCSLFYVLELLLLYVYIDVIYIVWILFICASNIILILFIYIVLLYFCVHIHIHMNMYFFLEYCLLFKINLSLFICVLFYSSFVCISAYANVYFQTTIRKQNIKTILIAGVPSSQAFPGFLITAPPSVCVPAVIGVLTVWNQKQKKNQNCFVYFIIDSVHGIDTDKDVEQRTCGKGGYIQNSTFCT